MQKILASKTASLTDLRDPMKVIESAGNDRVAILNRDKVVAYLVPASHVEEPQVRYATDREVMDFIKEIKQTHAHILEYLKDK